MKQPEPPENHVWCTHNGNKKWIHKKVCEAIRIYAPYRECKRCKEKIQEYQKVKGE